MIIKSTCLVSSTSGARVSAEPISPATSVCDPEVTTKAWLKAGRKKLPAEQGQLIEFEREEGVLEIEAPLLKLIVKCTDDSDNRSRKVVQAPPSRRTTMTD
jgi:hypothetical protein